MDLELGNTPSSTTQNLNRLSKLINFVSTKTGILTTVLLIFLISLSVLRIFLSKIDPDILNMLLKRTKSIMADEKKMIQISEFLNATYINLYDRIHK